ncbi:MAG: phage portal protein [Oceanibaculum nanhaiense]|jgi:HK97 family phage portal protein|uniref:phage portal protein n=1 Tax=Oceanibaculum nanhaiense TaxID=1909734 RepID=UPI0032EC1B17
MMNLFGPSQRQIEAAVAATLEKRSSLENPSVSLSDPAAWKAIFGSWQSASQVEVTPDKAMGVTAFWAGVCFLAGSIASIPIYLYDQTESGQQRADNNPLYPLLNEAPNDHTSAFTWRMWAMVNLLQNGRCYSLIERAKSGKVLNIYPLQYAGMTVERVQGRLRYRYRDGGSAEIIYEPSSIIDLVWMPKADGLGHYNPIETMRNSLGASIAMDDYAAKFFANGGIPPLQLVGPLSSPDAITRAAVDMVAAIKAAKKDQRPILPMPTMHELKPIGLDPEKGQMIEARRFQVEEMARLLGLPPVFLQDLTHGTFTNTEQQDLHLTKHALRQWFRRWEDELNLKLIARRGRKTRIRFDEDEIMRGDFLSRMEGYARGVQNALVTPDDARVAMGWPRKGGVADALYIQGATVPLGSQPMTPPSGAMPAADMTGDGTMGEADE